jgi:polar amino acid transport system ATP-binding protein
MKTINKIQTAAAGFVVERGDAREVLSNPQEPRTQAFLEQVL